MIEKSDATDEDLCTDKEKSISSNLIASSACLSCGEGRGQTSGPDIGVTNKPGQEIIFQGKEVSLSKIIIHNRFSLKLIEKEILGKRAAPEAEFHSSVLRSLAQVKFCLHPGSALLFLPSL